MRRIAAVGVFVLALVPVIAAPAGADPIGAKKSLLLPTTCGTVVLNSNDGNSPNPQSGQWSVAHLLDGNRVFQPIAVDLTFVFTPVGGSPETTTTNVSKPGPHQPSTTCTFDYSQTFPDGAFRIYGSATGVMH